MMKDRASVAVQMDEAVALSILAAARRAHPLEACGLLIGPANGPIRARTVARNIAADPMRRFEIDPGHLAQWQRRAREQDQRILGCWHSHPDNSLVPSMQDRAGADWPDLLWLIVGGDGMRLWRPRGAHFEPVPLVRCKAAA